MIDIIDITKVVTELLKDNFKLKVHANEVIEGFEKPSFFVDVQVINSNMDHVSYSKEQLLIIIQYFPETYNHLELLKIYEELKTIFKTKLYIKDRAINIDNRKMSIVDNTLSFRFSIEYNQVLEWREETEKMKEININKGGK